MCIINCRRSDSPEPEPAPRPVVVPLSSNSHPIPLQTLSPHHSRRSVREPGLSDDHRRSHSSVRVPLSSQVREIRLEPPARRSSQVIIIEKPKMSPRTSGNLGEGLLYTYGSGPVSVRRHPSSGMAVHNEARRSRDSQMSDTRRRRDSSAHYGKDPRASNTSWRSTRERIVVVDDMGTRREYYR